MKQEYFIKADAWLIVRVIFKKPVSDNYFKNVMQKVSNIFDFIDNQEFMQTYDIESFCIVPIDYEV